MALVNSIVIDLSALTSTLTVISSSNPVETVTYTLSTNRVNFASRSPINILGADFLNLITQFNLFQSSILTNFPVPTYFTIPFTEVQNCETNLVSSGQWNFYSVTGYSPEGRTVDYSAVGSNTTVNLNNRQFSTTINFTEWVYLLQALNHYNASVKAFFNL